MANQLDFQITEEGHRNAVLKLTGVLDTTDVSETPAVALSDFVNNDPRLVLSGLRVDLLEYVIGDGIEIILEWASLNPKQIFALAGRGRINSTNYGGFLPDPSRPGYNGNINLRTTGYVQGSIQNFTIVLELVKLYRVN